MEISRTLEEQLSYLEMALFNGVFSEDKLADHLQCVMQDKLAGHDPMAYDSATCKQLNLNKYSDLTDYSTVYPARHSIFTEMANEITILVKRNEVLEAEVKTLCEDRTRHDNRLRNLEDKVNVLVQTHNAKAEHESAIQTRIY